MYGIADQLLLGIVLALVHYFGEAVNPKLEKYHSELISLSAGIFVTLLFIDLLPTAAEDNLNFSLILTGFVAYHLIEKTVYLRHKSQIGKGELNLAGFFITNFRNGLAIALFYQASPQLAYLIMAPLIIAELATATLVSDIMRKMRGGEQYRITLALSILFGAVVGAVLTPAAALANNVLAFVIGTMFYIVIRDMLPAYKEGKTGYFLAGVISMWALLALIAR